MDQAVMSISTPVLLQVYKKQRASLPVYGSKGAAGADISACLEEELHLNPGEYTRIATGLYLEIPEGYEVQIRPRSGLAAKHGITVLNSPGTIDHDYRGEIQVILINHGKERFTVTHGMRIAQMVVAPVNTAVFVETSAIEASTERGIKGFGSTGTH